jgi:hypothetical protein
MLPLLWLGLALAPAPGVSFVCGSEDVRAFGLTCPASHPCPVYLELTSVAAAGEKLFLAGNLHTEDLTLYSVLLASADGGKTWSEPHERIRGVGLDQIQFLDTETGWVAGESLGAVPRDPFLLLTRDGGATWQAHPVFGEGRAGSIAHFHFDSKTHGMLWIDRSLSGETDRYESYESMNGGESWTLRETSAQPFGKSPALSTEIRLRTDAATRSYRVERRTPAGWETVASFPVRAGECRDQEPAPQEPPPASDAQ